MVFTWVLLGPEGAQATQHHHPRFVTTDMVTLRHAASAGIGVVQLPLMMVREQLANGNLIHLLPDWAPRREIIHVAFPTRRGLIPAVRVTIDHLAEQVRRCRGRLSNSPPIATEQNGCRSTTCRHAPNRIETTPPPPTPTGLIRTATKARNNWPESRYQSGLQPRLQAAARATAGDVAPELKRGKPGKGLRKADYVVRPTFANFNHLFLLQSLVTDDTVLDVNPARISPYIANKLFHYGGGFWKRILCND